MKRLLLLSMFFATTAMGNPGVKKDTDIGKREVDTHNQVTRCSNGECKINTVTTFKKQEVKLQERTYYGECNYSEQTGIRVSECKLKAKKPKAKVKTVIKKVRVPTYKKNRVQLHIANGPTGLEKSGDNNSEEIKEKIYYFQGLQYTRMLNSRFSIGATIFTNKSASVTMGLDY